MLVSVHTSQFEINKHNDLILKARLKINICIYAYPHTCERYFLLPYFTRLVMLALHVIRKQMYFFFWVGVAKGSSNSMFVLNLTGLVRWCTLLGIVDLVHSRSLIIL